MICNGLGVIARAGRDDTASALFVRQIEQAIERPAVLERPGALHTFELQVQPAGHHVAEGEGRDTRGGHDAGSNPLRSGLDIINCSHGMIMTMSVAAGYCPQSEWRISQR